VQARKASRELRMSEEPELGEAAKDGIFTSQLVVQWLARTRALTFDRFCAGHRRRLKGGAVRC